MCVCEGVCVCVCVWRCIDAAQEERKVKEDQLGRYKDKKETQEVKEDVGR